MSLMTDFKIAVNNIRILIPQWKIGQMPGLGGIPILIKLIGVN